MPYSQTGDGNVELSAVPYDAVFRIWNYVGPVFQKLVDRENNETLQDIYNKIAVFKTDTLWIVFEKENLRNILGAGLTRIINNGKTLELYSCAGKQRGLWFKKFPVIESFARDCGCTELAINGRLGWKRELVDDNGMKIAGYIYRKKLSTKDTQGL